MRFKKFLENKRNKKRFGLQLNNPTSVTPLDINEIAPIQKQGIIKLIHDTNLMHIVEYQGKKYLFIYDSPTMLMHKSPSQVLPIFPQAYRNILTQGVWNSITLN